jgi:phasin
MTKSSTSKVPRDAHRKTAPKLTAGKARPTNGKTAPKVAVGEARDTAPKLVPKVATEKARNAQFEEFRDTRDTQVPNSMRALVERSVDQTRELYEHSKNTLKAVLESWEKSFGAASEGAVALNHKMIDIAERNINTGFDLATSLAGANNLAEVMELQAAYWRKQFGELTTQAEEVRVLSTEVFGNVAEPIKAQVTRGMNESMKRIKSIER